MQGLRAAERRIRFLLTMFPRWLVSRDGVAGRQHHRMGIELELCHLARDKKVVVGHAAERLTGRCLAIPKVCHDIRQLVL